MYLGHNFVKFGNGEWVFDRDNNTGYKVILGKNGKIESRVCAFKVDKNSGIKVERFVEVPVGIVRDVMRYIEVGSTSRVEER